MGNVTIYPKGTADITVPAGQSIAISNFGGGIAQIYYLITAANAPPAFQFQQILKNSSVTLGAFSAETIVRIEANNSKVIYDVGASPDTGIGDADTLNGLPSDTADTADTIAARDSSGDIQANAFESTVATGTPPLTVASTTLNTNLNADLLDNQHGTYYRNASNINAGTIGDAYLPASISSDITGNAATATNADKLDGYQPDSNATANTIALRDINARIKGEYSNFTSYDRKYDGTSDTVPSDTPLNFYFGEVNNDAVNYPSAYGSLFGNNNPSNGYGYCYQIFKASSGEQLYFRGTSGSNTWSSWRKIFHEGSDGSLSGLDADLLDGQHGSYYAIKSAVSGTFTTTDGKTVTVTNGVITAIV